MSREFAQTDSGKVVLVRIECDYSECNASIRPHKKIAESGWICARQYRPDGRPIFDRHYCPEHGPR